MVVSFPDLELFCFDCAWVVAAKPLAEVHSPYKSREVAYPVYMCVRHCGALSHACGSPSHNNGVFFFVGVDPVLAFVKAFCRLFGGSET